MTLHWWMHWFWITWDIPVFLPLLLVVPVQSLPAKYESSPVYPLFSEEDLLPKDTSEVTLGSIHDQAEKLWDVPHSQPFISNTSEHPNSTDSAPKDLDNITTEISLIEGVESSPTSYSSDELAVFGSDTVSESSAISDRQNSDLMFKDVVVTSDSDVLIAGDGDFVSSSTSHGDNRSVESVSDEWLENSSEMTVNVSSDNFGSAVQNPTDNTSNPSLLPTSSEQSHFDASTKFPSTRSGKSIGFVTPSSYDPPNVHERNVSVSNISSHVGVSTKLPDVNEDRKDSVPSAVERSVLEPEKQSKSVVSPRLSETSGDQVTTTVPYHHIPQFEPEENRSEENSKPSRPGISSKSYQPFQHDIALSDQAPEDSATKNKTQGLVNNEEIQKNASSKVVHNRVIFSHTISAGERNDNSSKTGSSVENGTSADSEEADNDSSQATNSRKEQTEETSNSTDKADVNAENEDESELPTLLPNNHPSLFNVVSPYDVEGSINTNEGLIPTVTTVMKGRISVYEGLNTASIIGITLGIVAFAGLIGIVSFFLYRRRYINKPQTLSDKCSNPDSSGYIDDTLRENSEEMYSLDNDSFLNSLEAMTIQNYWTDSVKHTKL